MTSKAVGFMTEDFLLQTEFARILYHQYVKDLPIIDYHCHLSPHDIAANRQFEDITAIWLDGDHYKWRAMRTLGVDEKFITGAAPSREKFQQWAHTVPFTMRNPLYHWTHLELQRYFGISTLLSPESADKIYDATREKLNTASHRVRSLITSMKVETICTTDDPIDSLMHHELLRKENFSTTVLPTFRPDKAFLFENTDTYNQYLNKLSEASGTAIVQFSDLIAALENRINFFHAKGCRLADHGLEQVPYFPDDRDDSGPWGHGPVSHEPDPPRSVSPRTGNTGTDALNENSIFKKIRANQLPSRQEKQFFQYKVLLALSRLYHQHGWTQQFHLGALRNNNSRMLRTLGPDTGFDSVGDFSQGTLLAKFLNELDSTNQLAKTILYNLNPADNEVMATMAGNFSDGSVKGKIQFGSAWWFLDQKDGMEKQLNAVSNLGMLSCFIGMLTDSRSFLSFPRHEYFRRILCNLIGNDVARGELPADEKWLGKLVADVCYHNAKNYFNFTSRS